MCRYEGESRAGETSKKVGILGRLSYHIRTAWHELGLEQQGTYTRAKIVATSLLFEAGSRLVSQSSVHPMNKKQSDKVDSRIESVGCKSSHPHSSHEDSGFQLCLPLRE